MTALRQPVLFDSQVLVAYVLEGDPLLSVARRLLESVRARRLRACCSVVSLQEAAYVLKRENKNAAEVQRALALLLEIPNLQWLSLTPQVFRLAMDWMSRYSIGLSDSLIAATVLENNLAAIVTTDDDFKRLPFLQVLSPAKRF